MIPFCLLTLLRSRRILRDHRKANGRVHLPNRFWRGITRIPPLGSRLKLIFLTSYRTVGNLAWERGGQPIPISFTATSSVFTALSVMHARVQTSVQILTQITKGRI